MISPSEKAKMNANDFIGRSNIRAYSSLRARGIAGASRDRRREAVPLRGELICHAGVSVEDYAKPVADAARWPQPPLILGEKWDF